MYKMEIPNMDLAQIAQSGQCFRFREITPADSDVVKPSESTYELVAFGRHLTITQSKPSSCLYNPNHPSTFSFSINKEEWNNIFSYYFDINTNYEEIGKMINTSDDDYLKECYKYGAGIRILRQDLWEMIVTFMISQNNNIKRITNSVELLCKACGKKTINSSSHYSFPRPEDAPLEVFDDPSMGFGYRAEYLRDIFDFTKNNPEWLHELSGMDYQNAMASLLVRKGIGPKVANCICLFGLHHIDAFPVDTHVKQILNMHYPNGIDLTKYNGAAGIIQQYMFYHKIHKA